MKKKLLNLIALGLVCVPFACNATSDNTHIAYTESYFGLNDNVYLSEVIEDDVKEYNKLTFKQDRVAFSGQILLKKDAKIGGFDILHNPLTYVVNGDNVVSELPGSSDNKNILLLEKVV